MLRRGGGAASCDARRSHHRRWPQRSCCGQGARRRRLGRGRAGGRGRARRRGANSGADRAWILQRRVGSALPARALVHRLEERGGVVRLPAGDLPTNAAQPACVLIPSSPFLIVGQQSMTAPPPRRHLGTTASTDVPAGLRRRRGVRGGAAVRGEEPSWARVDGAAAQRALHHGEERRLLAATGAPPEVSPHGPGTHPGQLTVDVGRDHALKTPMDEHADGTRPRRPDIPLVWAGGRLRRRGRHVPRSSLVTCFRCAPWDSNPEPAD